MRKILLAGAVIAFAGSTVAAQAQSATPGQPITQAPPSQTTPPLTRGMMSSGMGHGEMSAPMMGGSGMSARMTGRGETSARMMRGGMFNTNAAVLHFRIGDLSMTVKCADNESTEVCVNAASALLERVRQNPSPASHH
ncbi:MAG: hypothetical protein ACREFP_14535 [Acetobacteraceae bacterium]